MRAPDVPILHAMTRVLSLAVFGVLIVGMLLLPNPRPDRLGAFQAGTTLTEPVSPGGDASADEPPPQEDRQ